MLINGQNKIGASDDSTGAFKVSKGITRIVDSVHRRRTSSVDSDARSVQIEDMADSVANNARIYSRGGVAVSEVRLFERHLLKITCEAADEDSGGSARDLFERHSTRFKSFVDDF